MIENYDTAEEWLTLINSWESVVRNETAVKRYVSLNHVYTAAFQVIKLIHFNCCFSNLHIIEYLKWQLVKMDYVRNMYGN